MLTVIKPTDTRSRSMIVTRSNSLLFHDSYVSYSDRVKLKVPWSNVLESLYLFDRVSVYPKGRVPYVYLTRFPGVWWVERSARKHKKFYNVLSLIVFMLLALLYGSTLIVLPPPLGLTLPTRNNPSTPLYSCQISWVLPGRSGSRIRESPVNEHVLFFDKVGIVETASLSSVVVLLAGFGN